MEGLVIWREAMRTENLGMWIGVELCMLGSKIESILWVVSPVAD